MGQTAWLDIQQSHLCQKGLEERQLREDAS